MNNNNHPEAKVVWWDSSSMYVDCPYCEQVHRHGFCGTYAKGQSRVSHCDSVCPRTYALSFPVSTEPDSTLYEIDKERVLFVRARANPSEYFSGPLDVPVESFVLEVKNRPKWSDATKKSYRDNTLFDLPIFEKRIDAAVDDVIHGHVRAVRKYLETSAESNILLHGSETSFKTSLHSSDEKDSESATNENIRVTGRTALHLAACESSSEMVELLLQKGADPNARDIYGQVPLMEAALWGQVENTKVLLKYGADQKLKCIRNGQPLQPVDFARPIPANIEDRYHRSMYKEVTYEKDQDRREIVRLLEGSSGQPPCGSVSLGGFSFLKTPIPDQLALLTYFNIPNERKTIGVLYRGHGFPPIAAMSGWAHSENSDMNIQISGKSWTVEVHRLSKYVGYHLQPKRWDQGIAGNFHACHAEKQLLAYLVHKHIFLPYELGQDITLADLDLDELSEDEYERRQMEKKHEEDLQRLKSETPSPSLKTATILVCRPICPDCKAFLKCVNDVFDLRVSIFHRCVAPTCEECMD